MRRLCLLLGLLVLLTACAAPAQTEAAPEPEVTQAPAPEPTPAPWEEPGEWDWDWKPYSTVLDDFDEELAAEEMKEFVLSNGLAPSMSYGEAVKLMGEPDRVETQLDSYVSAARYTAFFGGDILTFEADMPGEDDPGIESASLSAMQLRTPDIATARGARVGDSMESVQEAYGIEWDGGVDGVSGNVDRMYAGGHGLQYYDTVMDFYFFHEAWPGYVIFFMFNEGRLTGIMIRHNVASDWPFEIYPPPYDGSTEPHAGALIPYDVPAPLPEQGFELDSVWGGLYGKRTMLLLSAVKRGEVSGALYDADELRDGLSFLTMPVDEFEKLLAETEPRTVKFTARKDGDGVFRDLKNGVSLVLDGDELELEWRGEIMPMSRLTQEEASLAWAGMPLFEEEIKVPVPLSGRLSDLLEEYGGAVELGEYRQYFEINTDAFGMFGPVYEAADGGEMYSVFFYSSLDNGDHSLSVRGIEIGDSALDVAARFPNRCRLPDPPLGGESGPRTLYGVEDRSGWFGTVSYSDGGVPEVMVYSTGFRFIKLYFDEAGYLREIAFTLER